MKRVYETERQITALLEDIGKYKGGWVDVKVSLPEEGVKVLVVTDDGMVDFANIVGGVFMYMEYNIGIKGVIYWMLLPRLPETVHYD